MNFPDGDIVGFLVPILQWDPFLFLEKASLEDKFNCFLGLESEVNHQSLYVSTFSSATE